MTHIPSLDGLRAFAILIVFVAHCGLEKYVPGGLGVTLFFFLSGYLITSLLRSERAQTDRIDLKAFYIRRTLRIWPPLYLTVAFVASIDLLVTRDQPITVWGIVAQLAFYSNYTMGTPLQSGAPLPLWSLAVEEHFYLVFPLLFGVLWRKIPAARIALWCAFGCAAVLLIRIGAIVSHQPLGLIYYWSHTRIDSILFGCCLALWQNPAFDEDAWRPTMWHVASAIGVLVFCLVVRDEVFRQSLRYTLQGVALFVVFSYAIGSKGRLASILASRPLRLIALYSYTIYLVHVELVSLVKFLMPKLPTIGVILFGGSLSLGYAALMYALVEAPAARWRRSLHKVDASATLVDGMKL